MSFKVPIRVTEVRKNADGSAVLDVEFDDDVKQILMKAWGIETWDQERAQREFKKAITSAVNSRGEN
jgi:hypothetical protein